MYRLLVHTLSKSKIIKPININGDIIDKIKILKNTYPDSFELKYKINSVLREENFIDAKILPLISNLRENNLKTTDSLLLKNSIRTILFNKYNNAYTDIDTFIRFIKNLILHNSYSFNTNGTIQNTNTITIHSNILEYKNKLLQEIIYDYINTLPKEQLTQLLLNLISTYPIFNKYIQSISKIFDKLSHTTLSKIILDFIYYTIYKNIYKYDEILLTNLFQYTGVYISNIIDSIPINENNFRMKCNNILHDINKSLKCDNLIDLSRKIPYDELNIKYISNCQIVDIGTQMNIIIDSNNDTKRLITVRSNVVNASNEIYDANPKYFNKIIELKTTDIIGSKVKNIDYIIDKIYTDKLSFYVPNYCYNTDYFPYGYIIFRNIKT